MAIDKIRLDSDLSKKLGNLSSLYSQPAVYIARRFEEIRNSIYQDAEKVLQDLQSNQPIIGDDELDEYFGRSKRARLEEAVEGQTKQHETEAHRASSVKTEFLQILNQLEANMSNQLAANSIDRDDEFLSLECRVREFMESPNTNSNINDFEESYSELALALVDQTNRLEKRIFGTQTLFYLSSSKSAKLGCLVHISDDFLTKEEVNFLQSIRYNEAKWFYIGDLKQIHQEIEKSMNESMTIYVRKPFVMTKSLFTISSFIQHLNKTSCDLSNKLIGFGQLREDQLGYSIDGTRAEISIAKNNYSLPYLDLKRIDGSDSAHNPFENCFECTRIQVDDKGLRLFESWLDPIFQRLESLDLSSIELESLNEKLLAKCVNLRRLDFECVYRADSKFSFNFLLLFPKLEYLSMSLPDIVQESDFEFFDGSKILKYLRSLDLYGAVNHDVNKKRLKLTEKAFVHLRSLQRLRCLSLSYFDIETIDQHTLRGLSMVENLTLENNRIARVHQDAFNNCSVELKFVTFRDNQIMNLTGDMFVRQASMMSLSLERNGISSLNEKCFRGLGRVRKLYLKGNCIQDLPAGVFDSLVGLHFLELTDNKIKRLRSGVFNNSTKLISLEFDNNPLEEIDDDAFRDFGQVESLSFKRCNLKSINNRMFTGLTKLYSLNLSYNQISSFQVMKIDGRGVKPLEIATANMTPREFKIVQENLFCDLRELESLSLAGNKLENLDLNCFWNLRKLHELNLSSNVIKELNKQARPGTLAHLTTLNLKSNQLAFIDNHAFSQSTTLWDLNLSNNMLERINADFFVSFPQLRWLQIQSNSLDMTINQTTFPDCLERLDAIENRSIQVGENAFKNKSSLLSLSTCFSLSIHSLANLREITLYKSHPNDLERFFQTQKKQPSAFNIQRLSLVSCWLQTLNDFSLGTLFPKLTSLELRKNKFTTLESSWFDNMSQLDTLVFSNNHIDSLNEPAMFRNLPNLQTINLSNNRLRRINRRLFSILPKLCKLDLSNNQLFTIDAGIFRGLTKLQAINLSGNNLSNFNFTSLFNLCQHLRKINLSDNQLDHRSLNKVAMLGGTTLESLLLVGNRLDNMEFVQDLVNLRNLDLSNNMIKSLDSFGQNLLGRLMELKHLNLSSNLIRSISKDSLAHLDQKLYRLDFSNNPLERSAIEAFKQVRLDPQDHWMSWDEC